MSEYHFDGKHEQQRTAGDPESAKADAEGFQQRRADESKSKQRGASDDDGLDSCLAAVGGGHVLSEGSKYRCDGDGIDNYEKGHKRRCCYFKHPLLIPSSCRFRTLGMPGYALCLNKHAPDLGVGALDSGL